MLVVAIGLSADCMRCLAAEAAVRKHPRDQAMIGNWCVASFSSYGRGQACWYLRIRLLAEGLLGGLLSPQGPPTPGELLILSIAVSAVILVVTVCCKGCLWVSLRSSMLPGGPTGEGSHSHSI
jgi:hypothetical protein